MEYGKMTNSQNMYLSIYLSTLDLYLEENVFQYHKTFTVKIVINETK